MVSKSLTKIKYGIKSYKQGPQHERLYEMTHILLQKKLQHKYDKSDKYHQE